MRASLNTKLLSIVGVLALLIVGIVGVTFWVTEAQKADAVVINLAGRQRMLTQKMTKATLGYVIELREVDEARKQVDLLVKTRGHLARSITAAKQAGEFELTQNTLNFAPAAAARQIAADFSQGKRFKLRQVTRKFRNPENKPDEYEDKILIEMEKNPDQWKDRDWSEKVIEGDHATMRYMRPLIVAESCLTCHGDANKVPGFIREAYPEDRATGYQLGELRGAISVSWPSRNMILDEHKTEAQAARALFAKTLAALLNGGPAPLGDENPVLPPCTDGALRAQLQLVTDLWKPFDDAVQKVFAESDQDGDTFLAALNLILARNTNLLGEMNKAVGMFQALSDERTALMRYIQYGALGMALLVFCVTAFFLRFHVTRPILRIINGLNEGSDQVNHEAERVAGALQHLSEGAGQQASALEESSSVLEQMAAMTQANADSAREASQFGEQARNAAQNGNQTMEKFNAAMAGINESSGRIRNIIKVIEEIAFQTNLLALNAAVEAARAGEHGKGFAVVADEVRNLAQRCAKAAGETTGLIEDSVNRAKEGSVIAADVGQVLNTIVGDVTKVTDLIHGIDKGSGELAQGVGQINTSVSQIDKVTQQNAASAEESATAARQLNEKTRTVKNMVDEISLLIHGR